MAASQPFPTPGDLRALAARAEQVAVEVAAAEVGLGRAGDEPTRRVGWRLGDAAGAARQAAVALTETARDLEIIQTVRGRPHCAADWGCCPEHGNTLRGTGGRCWCTAPGCGRSWEGRRMNLPCDEPPGFRLVDARGGEGLVCAGHAVAARMQLEGARLLSIEAEDLR